MVNYLNLIISKINGFEPDAIFAVKAYMQSQPVKFLTVMIAISIIVFGIIVRNFERPLGEQAPSTYNFESYINAFWCMILTMTTVGYGDIFPVTHLGRISTIFACIWGTFVVSMIIVTLTDIISLTKAEEQAYESLSNDNSSLDKLRLEAIELIQAFAKYNFARKRNLDMRKRLNTRTEFILVKNR